MRGLIFFVIAFALQSALRVLLPGNFQPPDLFLLVALTLAARLRPPVGLGLGYGIGLLRDLLGTGTFGLHAAGIAAGVYAGYGVRRLLSAETGINHAVAVAVAEFAKWGVFLALNYWTRQGFISTETWGLVFAPELVATLVFGPFVYGLASWAFGPVPNSEERLL